MSSHREAPGISKDPVADNTDVYAWRTPGDTVTIIANFLPSQAPASGPNFFEFDPDVYYDINIDNTGDGKRNIRYRFRFNVTVPNENTFLYNTGPITSLDSPNWNRRQQYDVFRQDWSTRRDSNIRIGTSLFVPPCNVGPRSTPNYEALAQEAVYDVRGGVKVFCGQRADAFFVDLGSVFDLGTLRPFQNLHLLSSPAEPGVDSLATANVHTIAIQVPIASLTRDGSVPSDVTDLNSTIGVWAAASRQKGSTRRGDGTVNHAGPWIQVSRLGNPLFNEVIVPMARKDAWNASDPDGDAAYSQNVYQPELAKLLPVLYPGVFPNLAGLTADRADLHAILLTGIPEGLIPGFQNFTGPTPADMLRLNVAIPPAEDPNPLGVVGGDIAGFPNGRRLIDDVVAIELKAVAGAVYNLVDPSYTPDGAAGLLEDGTRDNPGRVLLDEFPYMGTPHSGYDVP